MNTEIHRKMPAQKPGLSKQDYATPREFINAVEDRFGKLRFDLAAHKRNTRCKLYYSLEEGVDSLGKDWTKLTGNLWLNPPFADIEPWARKCWESTSGSNSYIQIFFLTPASVGANWFADHVWHRAQILFLRGRLSFDGVAPYPKDCMLSVFGGGRATGCNLWDWRAPLSSSVRPRR